MNVWKSLGWTGIEEGREKLLRRHAKLPGERGSELFLSGTR